MNSLWGATSYSTNKRRQVKRSEPKDLMISDSGRRKRAVILKWADSAVVVGIAGFQPGIAMATENSKVRIVKNATPFEVSLSWKAG